MAFDFNRLTITGRVLWMREYKYDGGNFVRFLVGSMRLHQTEPEKFFCKARGKPGEIAARYLKRGDHVLVHGEVKADRDKETKAERWSVEVYNIHWMPRGDPVGASHFDFNISESDLPW